MRPLVISTFYAQKKEKSWEELKQDYEFPGWYARHMYMKDVGGQNNFLL